MAAGSRAGIDGRLSSPPSGVEDGSVSYSLDALCKIKFQNAYKFNGKCNIK